MDKILQNVDHVFLVYIEDILIVCDNQNTRNFLNMLQILHNNTFRISQIKSEFVIDDIDFLSLSVHTNFY